MTQEERDQCDAEALRRTWQEGLEQWREDQRNPVRAFARVVVAAIERGERAKIVEACQRVIEAALPEPVDMGSLRRRTFPKG